MYIGIGSCESSIFSSGAFSSVMIYPPTNPLAAIFASLTKKLG